MAVHVSPNPGDYSITFYSEHKRSSLFLSLPPCSPSLTSHKGTNQAVRLPSCKNCWTNIVMEPIYMCVSSSVTLYPSLTTIASAHGYSIAARIYKIPIISTSRKEELKTGGS